MAKARRQSNDSIDALEARIVALETSAPKAFVRFNSLGVIASAYNVASVVKDGADTGDWIITFSVPLANANYSAVVTASDNAATANGGVSYIGNAYAYSTTQVRVSTANHANAATDTSFTSVVIF